MNLVLSNQDLYEKVRETILELRKINKIAEAISLEQAMHISSLAGEVLGEIRLALGKIDKAGLTREVIYVIDSEITYIDSVLG